MSNEAIKTETNVVTAKPKVSKRKRREGDAAENNVVSDEVQNQLQSDKAGEARENNS